MQGIRTATGEYKYEAQDGSTTVGTQESRLRVEGFVFVFRVVLLFQRIFMGDHR